VRARIEDVREYGARPHEHIVLELHSLIDADVVLDAHALTNPRSAADETPLPQLRSRTDAGSFHDMAKVPNLDALA
jgi:hypothetical protein